MTKKTFSPFEPDLESKAFLYQQVVDMQRVLNGQGSLSIVCEKRQRKNGDDRYAVTFSTPDLLNFTSREEGDSLVEASMKAKESLLSKLNFLMEDPADDAGLTSVQYLH